MSRRLLSVMGLGLALAISVPGAGAAEKAKKAPAAKQKQPAAANPARKLRAEWDIADLKLQREAVEDADFPLDIKAAAMAAVERFVQQQEALIGQVQADPGKEASARKARGGAEAEFRQKMAVVYNNPALMAELSRRLQALRKEMDDLAAGAEKMFAKLDAVGLSPQQKAKLKPVVDQAHAQAKKAVDKSETKSPRDKEAREEIVKTYKDARAKVKQELTPEQREKLKKKQAE